MLQLPNLTEIEAAFSQWDSLAPLSECSGLTRFDLSGATIADASALRELTGLTSLSLAESNIDLSLIAGMTGLKTLNVSDQPCVDLSPLAGLTEMQELYLNSAQVSDLSPMAGMTGLQVLTLYNSTVTDLSLLARSRGERSGADHSHHGSTTAMSSSDHPK